MKSNDKLISNVLSFLKKICGINDVSLLRKKIVKNCGKILYHKKYTSIDLVNLMCDMGMTKGSLVCIHSSMMQFYNFQGTALELIEQIINVIGPEGTLMMPAFPIVPKDIPIENYIFNPLLDKTGAGFLAETFRKYNGVKRSCNVRASVCAIGPLADELLREHVDGIDCWDEKSPWYKLCMNNGLVFNLGLPHSYMGTFYHCVESRLKKEHPYWAQFFNTEREYRYIEDGVIKHYTNIDSEIYRRTKKSRIMKYFTQEDWKVRQISNLKVKVFYTGHIFPKLVDMGRHGITSYYCPSPKKYVF